KSIPGKVIAVIFNRVASARAAFSRLRVEAGAETILLTGRTRPYDRDRLIENYQHRFKAGRARDGDQPLYVIATQCIEVGADFDFDALVTECAALDALRQRFGRLDRLGAITDARGVVLLRSDALGKDDA